MVVVGIGPGMGSASRPFSSPDAPRRFESTQSCTCAGVAPAAGTPPGPWRSPGRPIVVMSVRMRGREPVTKARYPAVAGPGREQSSMSVVGEFWKTGCRPPAVC